MRPLTQIKHIAFDAYGTLFDFNSAVDALRGGLGTNESEILHLWRTKQIEYTWLRSLMKRYVDFETVTADALRYAMNSFGISDSVQSDKLLGAYRKLSRYPDVKPALQHFKAYGLKLYILSNGTDAMLKDAVQSAGLEVLIDEVISVDAIKKYKPSPEVYQLVLDRAGVSRDEVVFVSGNPWDVAGASTFGLRVAWLNRAGLPAEELPFTPEVIITDMRNLPVS